MQSNNTVYVVTISNLWYGDLSELSECVCQFHKFCVLSYMPICAMQYLKWTSLHVYAIIECYNRAFKVVYMSLLIYHPETEYQTHGSWN